MAKKEVKGKVFLLILAIFIIPELAQALTVSPVQIMIPSNLIKEETKKINIFLELEEGETTRNIRLDIPDKYQEYIFFNKNKITLRNKIKIELKLKKLNELEPGEHNINIDIKENQEIIKDSINNKIQIKAIVPQDNKKTKNDQKEEEDITAFIVLAAVFSIIIIVITLFLIIKLDSIRKQKIELNAETLEEKTKLQETKIDDMIEKTSKILDSLTK